jgi:hypothetical protein
MLRIKKEGTMKKIAVLAVVMIMAAGLAGSAYAANSLNAGAKALSIGFGDSALNNVANPTDAQPRNPIVDISGRLFISKDTAITGGFGFQLNSGDVDGTYLSLNAGIRKYLKTDDFAPFVGGQFSYITYDAEAKNAAGVSRTYADYSAWEFAGILGAEYFLSKAFSIEGSIGVALGSGKDSVSHNDTTYLGTRNMGVRANFYF